MAQVSNPRKAFQFAILINGINSFLCQEVTTPEQEFDDIMHGDTNFDVKTAGKVKYGPLVVQKICYADFPDAKVQTWFKRCQNVLTGGGLLPSVYKETIQIIQYAPDGVSILQTWTYEGCWPRKLNGQAFDRMKSENTIEHIEFSVDRKLD